ncbi:hypothetical protein TKK_0019034 [Trichogramma kaykai]
MEFVVEQTLLEGQPANSQLKIQCTRNFLDTVLADMVIRRAIYVRQDCQEHIEHDVEPMLTLFEQSIINTVPGSGSNTLTIQHVARVWYNELALIWWCEGSLKRIDWSELLSMTRTGRLLSSTCPHTGTMDMRSERAALRPFRIDLTRAHLQLPHHSIARAWRVDTPGQVFDLVTFLRKKKTGRHPHLVLAVEVVEAILDPHTIVGTVLLSFAGQPNIDQLERVSEHIIQCFPGKFILPQNNVNPTQWVLVYRSVRQIIDLGMAGGHHNARIRRQLNLRQNRDATREKKRSF